MEYLLKPYTTMSKVEELAYKAGLYFTQHPDAIKLNMVVVNDNGEEEIVGVVHNPRLRGMYEQIEWLTSKHEIKCKARTVKLNKEVS